jgi:predicted ATPase
MRAVDIPSRETLLSLATLPFVQDSVLPAIKTQLAGWSVYHEFRTDSGAAVRQPIITRYDKRVASDGHNIVSVLHTLYTGNREFKDEIDAAMRAAFGDEFVELLFAPASDQRIQLRVRWKSLRREQSAADLSDGTLRFLLLLTVLASPDPAPLIAIDEPETGLHPSMLPIIAEFAREASRRTQVILTTHSPQFLDAFGKEPPRTVVIRWNAGQSELKTLAGEELGEWLKEYSLGSLYRSGELEAMGA